MKSKLHSKLIDLAREYHKTNIPIESLLVTVTDGEHSLVVKFKEPATGAAVEAGE